MKSSIRRNVFFFTFTKFSHNLLEHNINDTKLMNIKVIVNIKLFVVFQKLYIIEIITANKNIYANNFFILAIMITSFSIFPCFDIRLTDTLCFQGVVAVFSLLYQFIYL